MFYSLCDDLVFRIFQAFGDLICLTRLDLSNNELTSEALLKTHFWRLHSLSYLDLSGNPLETLDDSIIVAPYMPQVHTHTHTDTQTHTHAHTHTHTHTYTLCPSVTTV